LFIFGSNIYSGNPGELTIDDNNNYINIVICYYSKSQPTDTEYRYWHYVDDVSTLW